MPKQMAMVDYRKCDRGICLAVLACPNKSLSKVPLTRCPILIRPCVLAVVYAPRLAP